MSSINSKNSIQNDLKIINNFVNNLGKNIKSQVNTPANQQKNQQTNTSPVINPHNQEKKVLQEHENLSSELENKDNHSEKYLDHINKDPHLTDDQKKGLVDEHKSLKSYLDDAREHLNDAKEKASMNYKIAQDHLKNAKNTLGNYHKSMTDHINNYTNIVKKNLDTLHKSNCVGLLHGLHATKNIPTISKNQKKSTNQNNKQKNQSK